MKAIKPTPKFYCNYCGVLTSVWQNEYGWTQERICQKCYEQQRQDPTYNRKNKDGFCIVCGKTLKQYAITGRDGKEYSTAVARKYCFECNPRNEPKAPRSCIICGKPLTGRSIKYCPVCKPYGHNPNRKLHSLLAQKWQRNNKEKAKCSRLARYYPHKVKIIYECPCKDNGTKHQHHFDYARPFEVLLLCHKCHRAEHTRLRNLELQNSSPVRQSGL